MDRIAASEAADMGSIPIGHTKRFDPLRLDTRIEASSRQGHTTHMLDWFMKKLMKVLIMLFVLLIGYMFIQALFFIINDFQIFIFGLVESIIMMFVATLLMSIDASQDRYILTKSGLLSNLLKNKLLKLFSILIFLVIAAVSFSQINVRIFTQCDIPVLCMKSFHRTGGANAYWSESLSFMSIFLIFGAAFLTKAKIRQ